MWGQVPTSQNTHCYYITKHELVSAVSDTLAVHYDNYTEQIEHTMRAECSVSNVTVGGTHSYHRGVSNVTVGGTHSYHRAVFLMLQRVVHIVTTVQCF
jgi:hypothetical protein